MYVLYVLAAYIPRTYDSVFLFVSSFNVTLINLLVLYCLCSLCNPLLYNDNEEPWRWNWGGSEINLCFMVQYYQSDDISCWQNDVIWFVLNVLGVVCCFLCVNYQNSCWWICTINDHMYPALGGSSDLKALTKTSIVRTEIRELQPAFCIISRLGCHHLIIHHLFICLLRFHGTFLTE